MDDFFSHKAADFKTDPLPKPAPVTSDSRRANIQGALAQAKQHLNAILHNPLATKRQHVIIARYEAQLREIDNQEWLET